MKVNVAFKPKNHEYQIFSEMKLAIFDNRIMKHIISMLDAMELTHNFSKLNRLANNAEVRSLLKFLFIWYYRMFPFEIKSILGIDPLSAFSCHL